MALSTIPLLYLCAGRGSKTTQPVLVETGQTAREKTKRHRTSTSKTVQQQQEEEQEEK
jgi:hypothetical protein